MLFFLLTFDLKDFGFKLVGDPIQLVTDYQEKVPYKHISNFCYAPTRGNFAAAGPDGLIIGSLDKLKEDIKESKEQFETGIHKVPIGGINNVCFSADETTLVISVGLQLQYHTLTEDYKTVGPNFSSINFISDVELIAPCPVQGSTIAVLLSNGDLLTADISSGSAATISRDVLNFGWCPTAKKIAIANSDGSITLNTLDNESFTQITIPEELAEDGVLPLSIAWTNETTLFAVFGEQFEKDDDEEPSYDFKTFVIEIKDVVNFRETYDAIPAFGSIWRKPTIYYSQLHDLSDSFPLLTLLASSTSAEVSALSAEDQPLPANDSERASLPINEDTGSDVNAIGLIIDVRSTESVVEPCAGVSEADWLPTVWVLGDDGKVQAWYIFHVHDLKNGSFRKNGPVAFEDKMLALAQSDTGSSTTGAPAANENLSGSSSTKPFGASTFGSSATSAPVFGSSPFGSDQTVQPAFGSSGFGSSTGIQTAFGSSLHGSPTAAPVFGSNGFGTSGFGNSNGQPAFGSAGFGTSTGKPSFGSTAFGSTGFGASTDQTAFGSSSIGTETRPAFGSSGFGSNKPAFGSSGFGSTTSTDKPAFGSSGFASFGKSSDSPLAQLAANDTASPFGQMKTGSSSTESPFASFGKTETKTESPFALFGKTETKSVFDTKSPFESFGATTDARIKSAESPFTAFGQKQDQSSSVFGKTQQSTHAFGDSTRDDNKTSMDFGSFMDTAKEKSGNVVESDEDSDVSDVSRSGSSDQDDDEEDQSDLFESKEAQAEPSDMEESEFAPADSNVDDSTVEEQETDIPQESFRGFDDAQDGNSKLDNGSADDSEEVDSQDDDSEEGDSQEDDSEEDNSQEFEGEEDDIKNQDVNDDFNSFEDVQNVDEDSFQYEINEELKKDLELGDDDDVLISELDSNIQEDLHLSDSPKSDSMNNSKDEDLFEQAKELNEDGTVKDSGVKTEDDIEMVRMRNHGVQSDVLSSDKSTQKSIEMKDQPVQVGPELKSCSIQTEPLQYVDISTQSFENDEVYFGSFSIPSDVKNYIQVKDVKYPKLSSDDIGRELEMLVYDTEAELMIIEENNTNLGMFIRDQLNPKVNHTETSLGHGEQWRLSEAAAFVKLLKKKVEATTITRSKLSEENTTVEKLHEALDASSKRCKSIAEKVYALEKSSDTSLNAAREISFESTLIRQKLRESYNKMSNELRQAEKGLLQLKTTTNVFHDRAPTPDKVSGIISHLNSVTRDYSSEVKALTDEIAEMNSNHSKILEQLTQGKRQAFKDAAYKERPFLKLKINDATKRIQSYQDVMNVLGGRSAEEVTSIF